MKLKKIMGLSLAFLGLAGMASCVGDKDKPVDDPNPPVDGDNPGNDDNNTGGSGNTDTPGGNNNTGSGDNTGGNGSTGGNDNPGGNDNTGGGEDKPGGDDSSGTGGNSNVNNGSSQGAIDAGNGEVVSEGEIKITSCSGLNEAAYIEFNSISNASSYNVYLKAANASDYVLLNEKTVYIQELTSGKMRADLMGISAGEYNVKVVPVVSSQESKSQPSVCRLSVVAYDRSGYAHFKNTEGVGAYNDDGTLKDNAIVIYVTDENKDTVMGEVSEVSEYMFNIPGADWKNKQALGIGWWLNNAQYTKKDSSGTPGNTWDPNGQSLGFYSVVENHPIVIRFVGTVTTPEGCTAYDSLNEGGSENDNGHMARMKDLRNITLEGVGFDAIIDGWGFHFMASDTTGQRGKNFEARNLTFVNNPEDALGMEGVQASASVSSAITAPVQNCWIHHCTFFPGYCANPAESDKAEGDGSCDFKRGYNFTLSYCYFEYCHKTNLIGSASTSLQYNISMHHNVWYNCGSRIPLVRNANVHFYNNLVYGDATQVSTKAPASSVHYAVGLKASLSYVSSLRANAYMYSENNYFDGAKQVFDTGEGGGTAKCYGNQYVSCFQASVGNKDVSDREEAVSNKCQYTYEKIDYSAFDTNPDLFYYDTAKKQSDCYLTTAVVAREECLKYSGSYYRTILNGTSLGTETKANIHTPTEAVNLSSGSYTAPLASSKTDGMTGYIYYSSITGTTSSSCKFKGQGVTFTLTDYAIVAMEITASANGYSTGYLVSSAGEVMLAGSGNVTLAPGTYFITSVQKDKETTLTSLTFEKYNTEEYDAKRIADFNAKADAIPANITYTADCYDLIKAAIEAYKLLSSDLQQKVDYSKVQSAHDEYISLGEDYVEGLINSIGTVTKDSGSAISKARAAYDYLMTIDANASVSNFSSLTAAEEAFYEFAVQSCMDKINAIGTVTLNSKANIEAARTEYDSLDEIQKAKVTNYSTLKAAEEAYKSLADIENAKNQLIDADLSSLSSMKAALTAYNALTDAQKQAIDIEERLSEVKVSYTKALIDSIGTVSNGSGAVIKEAETLYDSLSSTEKSQITNYTILEEAREAYNEILSQTHEKTFDDGLTDSTGFFTISGSLQSKPAAKEYNGNTYTTAMKMESKTSISFTVEKTSVLTIVTNSASSGIKVNGTSYTTDADGILVLEIAAGAYSISKDNSLIIYALIVQ